VRRQLRRATGLDITPADFTADEDDQLRIWKQGQKQSAQRGRHRSGSRRRRFWSPRGR
jgi:hypothetical protein